MIPRIERPKYPPPNTSLSRPILIPQLVPKKAKMSHVTSNEECKWEEIESKLNDLEETVYHTKFEPTPRKTRNPTLNPNTQTLDTKKKKSPRWSSEVRSPYKVNKKKLTSLI
mmetsp:Transcript_32301/g.55878  ORF Transcript_32301/g.55878 Transcript_32301/m.55878 type:complete len:112 (-) Transcript_32301:8-343(-)